MYIYKIYNTINDKLYIGQTRRAIRKRFLDHVNRAKNGAQTRLYCAMRKHGIENFYIEVVEEVPDSENATELLNSREIYWITHYDSVKNGYNSTNGGDHNPMDYEYGKSNHNKRVRSKEFRDAVSNSMKEYRKTHPFTDEHRKHLSEAMQGNRNFGSGDTRSIGCYCIDEFGEKHQFHSIKDATVWWFDNYKPFGDRYVLITLQRKIRGDFVTHNGYNGVKWFKCEEKCVETIEKASES